MKLRLVPSMPAGPRGKAPPRAAANDESATPGHVPDRLLQGDLLQERRVARAQWAVCLLALGLVAARVVATCF